MRELAHCRSVGGGGLPVVAVEVIAFGVRLGNKVFLMGDFDVVHQAVFAMGGRGDAGFVIVVPSTEIEPFVVDPVEVVRREGEVERTERGYLPPLQRDNGEMTLEGVEIEGACGQEAVA